MEIVWVLPAGCAAVDWYAVWRGDRRTECWAKPAALIALILVAVLLGAGSSTAGWWLLVALALGLAGDVFLLGRSDTRFRLGLAAFLVGHLGYAVSFGVLGLPRPGWSWLGIVVLGGCVLATRGVVPATHRRSGFALSVPVTIYTCVFGAMVVLAWFTGVGLIALGATVFAASDTILALNRFVRPRSWAPMTIMVTYHLGQALIVLGVLTR